MGLNRLGNGVFTHYTPHNGLVDSYVNSILEDNCGNLWLGGRKGISCVSKEELKNFASGKISKLQPLTYNVEDGMENQWCNSGAIKRRNGKLWFPTTSGAAEIDPTNILTDNQPPSVIIEELKVDGEQIPPATLCMLSGGAKSLVIPPGKKRLEFKYTGLSFLKPRKVKFKLKLQGYDPDWIDMGDARDTIYTELSPGKYTLEVIACNRDGVWNETGDSLSFYMRPYIYETVWFYIFVALVIIMIAFFGYRFRVRQLKAREKLLADLVNRRTKKLNQRTLQLEKAHDSLRESKQLIEEKNRSILDSIEYARRIQQAVLPPDQQIQTALNDYFIIFKPKDIVSGDFYWFSQRDNRCFIAVVDCTGHGVPGAFLSMIGNMKLNDIMYEEFIEDPAGVLSNLDLGVSRLLQQENGAKKRGDGMEVGLCMIDLDKNKIVFAGAKRPLYYVQDSQFFEIKGDRRAIGGRRKVREYAYTNHQIDINDEIVLYLSSDGLVDQHNPGDKKFGSPRLKRFLHHHAHLPMPGQKKALLKELSDHRGNENQRDDITLIGIKLKKTPPAGTGAGR
jgi:serine phosphatase RsbU (regulator of sigma subunit)